MVKNKNFLSSIHSTFIRLTSCFSGNFHSRTIEQILKSDNAAVVKYSPNFESSSISHVFSPSINLSMLRKVRCRVHASQIDRQSSPRTLLLVTPMIHDSVEYLNESQNCAADLSKRRMNYSGDANVPSSLIEIQIDDDKKLSSSDSYSLSVENTTSNCLSIANNVFSINSIRNTNSSGPDSISSNESIKDKTNSTSQFSYVQDRQQHRTYKLNILDALNKDGNRHFVMHKGKSH